ncbi:MAG: glycosyltransferase family 4 protein [Chloroflexota bacterium]
MKIALLSEKYTPDVGGLAISTERFARLLSSAGHDVRVFCPSINLSPSEKRTLIRSEVCVTRFGAHKRVDDTLVDWLELIIEEHRREPFDVFHAYFLTQAGFVSTYAGKYLNVPTVVSIRGNDIERAAFDPARFSHVMYALQNASAVTTNASELMKKAKAFIDREVILIPNGVDTDHFKPVERNSMLAASLGLDTERHIHERVIGFAGELREKKGLATLLRAYAQINRVQAAALLIVGGVRVGEDRKVFDEVESSIPNSKIIITGYVSNSDLPSYYSWMDVFVHPSMRDGMPNALLEAMACEKPVIATSVGGITDVVMDWDNGILVPANDAGALSNAISHLFEDESLRRKLGVTARQTIVAKFTPQLELEENLKIYRKLGLNS